MSLLSLLRPHAVEPTVEWKLLTACAAAAIDEAADQRIQALVRDGIHWDKLVGLAHRHRVFPLLFLALYPACREAISGDVLYKLRMDYLGNIARSLTLTQELIRVSRLLEAEGIEVIHFKGPVLAQSLYGDLALRQFDDIDIIVREEDFPAALNLVHEHDFLPNLDQVRAADWAILRRTGELGLYSPSRKIRLDMHWRVVPGDFESKIDHASLWRRRRRRMLLGKPVWELSPEDTLLVLSMHGMRHGWARLAWVCDLAGILHAYQSISWDSLKEWADSLGAGRILATGLSLVHEALGHGLPEPAMGLVEKHLPAVRLNHSARWEFHHPSRSPSLLQVDFLNILARQSLRDKLAYIRSRAVDPNIMELICLRVPRGLSFLYPFLRPFRLISRSLFPLAARRASRGIKSRGESIADSTVMTPQPSSEAQG